MLRRIFRGRSSEGPPDVAVQRGDRVLVTGWFSWPGMHATAGDLLARDVACDWLVAAGRDFDVANAPGYGAGVDVGTVDPLRYSELVFVCGPVRAKRPLTDLLKRFAGSRRIGLNVTMLHPLESWNGFDVVIERDSTRTTRPDLVLASNAAAVPVIGVVLIEPYQPEYPDRDRQFDARAAVTRLIESCPAAAVQIDTQLPENAAGLRNPSEVESLIARMDAIVTTRLHGLVLALKNGVPAVAIDPVAGGGKIRPQADVLGWPVVRTADALDDADLRAGLDFCLTPEARELARSCAARATGRLDDVRQEFLDVLVLDTSRIGSPQAPDSP